MTLKEEKIKTNRNQKLWSQFLAYQNNGGLTQKQFAEKFGLKSISNISQYLHGFRPLNLSAALCFARGMQIPLNKLIDDEDSNLVRDLYDALEKTPDSYQRGGKAINQYSLSQVAYPANKAKGEIETVVHGDYDSTRRLLAIKVTFDDMSPLYTRGDILIVDLEKKPCAGNSVLALIKNRSDAVVRTYSVTGIDKNGNDIFTLIPANTVFPTLSSDNIELRVIGVVVEQRKFPV